MCGALELLVRRFPRFLPARRSWRSFFSEVVWQPWRRTPERYRCSAEFFAYYRPHRKLFGLDFSCAVISGLLELAFPLAVGVLHRYAPPRQRLGSSPSGGGAALSVYLVNTGLMVSSPIGATCSASTSKPRCAAAASTISRSSPSGSYDNQKTGHLVGRVTKDLEEIGEVAHHGPEDAFIAVMTFIGAFALMFYVEPKLALITALIVPSITASSPLATVAAWRHLAHPFARVGEFNARIEENVGGIRVVQAFANEDHERTLFASDNRSYRETKLDAYRSWRRQHVAQLPEHAVHAAGGDDRRRLLRDARASSRRRIRHLPAAGECLLPAGGEDHLGDGDLSQGHRRLQALSRVAGHRTGYRRTARMPSKSGNLQGDIRYRECHVSATRRIGPCSSNIDLRSQAGETVAFVGPSGAGKTTIASLLPRFYEVDARQHHHRWHRYSGYDPARCVGKSASCSRMSSCSGAPIRENIAYGRLDATEAEIDEAARRARLDDMIALLPHGLDTIIGERGVKLSGGQKQRLAIARMFLKNPPILILDEATSRARHRDRAGNSGQPRRARRRPHHPGHCPPPGNHPECRPHRGGRCARDRRAGQAPGSPQARRRLRPPARGAVRPDPRLGL